jgi:histidine ammonia-lyase
MAHLAKTGKFKVWSTPSTEEGSVFVNELNRNPSSLVVVGGRKVTVEDVASVAVLMHSVSLDQSTIDKIDTDLASAKSKIGFSHPALSAVTQIDSAVYDIILNRAALFVRIVSLMVCRSGVRSEVIECLVEMLHSNVIPNFSSPELAGLELCACLTGATSSCFCDGVLMSSASAFAEADITPIGLTDSEFSTLKLGQFFSTGCICLIASGAANLGSMIDCVSALSCDTFGISIEPFDAVHFDVCRPHRGQIASATNLRLLLEGSKRVKNANAEPSFTDLVFGNIPQVHGPSLESISSLVK